MKVKYPRTFHFPWSPGKTSDDKVLKSYERLLGKEVVVTEKMDGENTTLYWNGQSHARSLDSANHPSRNWVKGFHSKIQHKIPDGCRICGENLYAAHSLKYYNLKSFFYGFSMWEGEYCFGWDFTMGCFEELGIEPVPVLWRGIFDEDLLKELASNLDPNTQEGFVVRTADGFFMEYFKECVVKYVRANHVAVSEHWMNAPFIGNSLA